MSRAPRPPSRKQFFMDIEMAKIVSRVRLKLPAQLQTYRITLPTSRHIPSPFSPHLTTHLPIVFPSLSVVSATVSSWPGILDLVSGSTILSASSHFANGRFDSIKKVASYTCELSATGKKYTAQSLTRVILVRRSRSKVDISIP